MKKLVPALCIAHLIFYSLTVNAEQTVDEEAIETISRDIEEILASPEFDPWEVKEIWKWKWQDEQSEDTNSNKASGQENNLFARMAKALVAVLPWFLIVSVVIFIIALIVIKKDSLKRLFKSPSSGSDRQKTRYLQGKNAEEPVLSRQVIGQAQQFWKAGKPKQALSLMYRGAISYLVNSMQIPIPDSATEGECLSRVTERLYDKTIHENIVSDFTHLIHAWLYSAYADRHPDDTVFYSLCNNWGNYFKDKR
ncbi:MAG: hypothetical protein JW822_06075 [Spirochaetales bacterium]|nr:hypothetical protein [Spirochaetales bacterium]